MLWRGTRDGFESSKFHSLCDRQGATITIIKTENEAIGGFTSVDWYRGGNLNDSKSFIFSLKTKMISNFVAGFAICDKHEYGPT